MEAKNKISAATRRARKIRKIVKKQFGEKKLRELAEYIQENY